MKGLPKFTDAEIRLLLRFIKQHIWWASTLQDMHYSNYSNFKKFVEVNPQLLVSLMMPFKKIPLCLGRESKSPEWDTAVYSWRLQIGK